MISRRLRAFARSALKTTAHPLGLDLVRHPSLAEETFLGLSRLPVKTVLDVGANLGQFARLAVRTFPAATIYSFEPQEGAFAQLRDWARKQRLGTIVPLNLALGDMDGAAEMKVHLAHPDSSSLLDTTETCHRLFPQTRAQGQMHVAMATLDHLAATQSLRLADDVLIKLDVQGFEDRVIRGGQNVFGRARACIVEIGLDPLYASQAGFHGLYLALVQLGFHYSGNLHQILADDGHVIYIDAVFIR